MEDNLELQRKRLMSLSIDILNMIKQRGLVDDISPIEAMGALTSVYLGGFMALKVTPTYLKEIFQLFLNDYIRQYEEED